jgi:anti-sigma factor RsiW
VGDPNKIPQVVTCQHSISLLQEYLDGTLPTEEREALERHFNACPPCIDFVKKDKATPHLCQKALVEEMPKDMGERLSSFLHERCKKDK